MDANRPRIMRILSIGTAVLAVGSVDRLRGHRHVQAGRLQRIHRIAGRTGSVDGPSPHDAGRRNHGRLALPPRVCLQRGHAGQDHDRGRVRSRSANTPRGKPLKPPKAASIAPTTSGARMRSNTTCSSARQTGLSASIFPTTSTGAARRAPSRMRQRRMGRIQPSGPVRQSGRMHRVCQPPAADHAARSGRPDSVSICRPRTRGGGVADYR